MVFDLVFDSSVSSLLSTYGYVAMVFLMVIEGPATAFVSGMLSAAGFFNPLAVITVFILVRFVTDTLFYQAGRSGSRVMHRWPFFRSYTQFFQDSEYQESTTRFFHNHFVLIFMFAKLLPVPNLASAISVAAGMFKIARVKFYTTLVLAQAIWSSLLVSAGFYVGSVNYIFSGDALTYILVPFLIVSLVYISQPYILRWLRKYYPVSDFLKKITQEQ